MRFSRTVLAAAVWNALACANAGCGSASTSGAEQPDQTTPPTGDEVRDHPEKVDSPAKYQEICCGGRWTTECPWVPGPHHC